ncbi:alpha pinene synthase, chloroplastic-like [Cryptomeria japonica]|uniref:alpha pinene synthase, chloroplastic-like n=1 Tax=Cryptomeria japonica TaxID=3369 RepID=UPI0027DA8146|nr:alpha pinene synthase, chloroplastic-like [Cryptomeria japonica]
MPTAKCGKSCAENAFERLVMGDKAQCLAIDRHFQNEKTQALDCVYRYWNDCAKDEYRSLGTSIPSTEQISYVLSNFKGNVGQFVCPSSLSEEEKIGSILNLYRASLIAFLEENIMDEAKAFAITYLNEALEKTDITSHLSRKFVYAATGFVTRIKQSVHRQELQSILQWWKDSDLDKVDFACHRHVEYFALACAYCIDAKYSAYRHDFAKLCALATIVDDIYDTYGTIEEIKLFNEAVKKWDSSLPNSLPKNIKIAYKAFYMAINESAQATKKTQGRDMLPYSREVV